MVSIGTVEERRGEDEENRSGGRYVGQGRRVRQERSGWDRIRGRATAPDRIQKIGPVQLKVHLGDRSRIGGRFPR